MPETIYYAEEVQPRITFRFVGFSPEAAQRGQPAAQVEIFVDGQPDDLLWMSEGDLRLNIATFGPSEDLRAALDSYEGARLSPA